jgi:hypothetical protein
MSRAFPVAAVAFVAALAVMPPGARADEPLAPLQYFVGKWMIEGDTTVGGKPTHWRAPYDIVREGGWLVGSATIFGNRIHDYWGWDGVKKDFVRIQLQSDGSRGEIHSPGWKGDTVAWTGEASGSDGDRTPIRTSQTRVSPDSFRVEWASFDGKQWKTYSRELLTRQPR